MAEFCIHEKHGGICEKTGGFCNLGACPYEDLKEYAPVKHGRWERDEWGSYLRRCSVCKKSPVYKDERGNSVAVYAGVCINCGARMGGYIQMPDTEEGEDGDQAN